LSFHFRAEELIESNTAQLCCARRMSGANSSITSGLAPRDYISLYLHYNYDRNYSVNGQLEMEMFLDILEQ